MGRQQAYCSPDQEGLWEGSRRIAHLTRWVVGRQRAYCSPDQEGLWEGSGRIAHLTRKGCGKAAGVLLT